jgi:hypothetical protein
VSCVIVLFTKEAQILNKIEHFTQELLNSTCNNQGNNLAKVCGQRSLQGLILSMIKVSCSRWKILKTNAKRLNPDFTRRVLLGKAVTINILNWF